MPNFRHIKGHSILLNWDKSKGVKSWLCNYFNCKVWQLTGIWFLTVSTDGGLYLSRFRNSSAPLELAILNYLLQIQTWSTRPHLAKCWLIFYILQCITLNGADDCVTTDLKPAESFGITRFISFQSSIASSWTCTSACHFLFRDIHKCTWKVKPHTVSSVNKSFLKFQNIEQFQSQTHLAVAPPG